MTGDRHIEVKRTHGFMDLKNGESRDGSSIPRFTTRELFGTIILLT